eukprot:TCONS_00060913-protein
MASKVDLFTSCRKIVGAAFAFKGPNPPPPNPVIFLKAPTSLLPQGEFIRIPEGCDTINHEVELGVVIGKGGSSIPENQVMDHIEGYVLALDMTSTSHFKEALDEKKPWLLAKCFDTFCPISEILSKSEVPDPDNVDLWLTVNGEDRQAANTKDLNFSISQLISYTSKITKLERGDLILTGTPGGISTVKSGDIIDCGFKGIKSMKFEVK